MASSEAYTHAQFGNTSPRSSARILRRASTQKDQKAVEEVDVVQGRILWLPPKEELPDRAVRRAHGKGAVEEGIYNHPIVVISRPADDRHTVHFHLITSFQGKQLSEIYGKANEFHASRRSWYLPIAPTPDHPDATSKKSRKRFPTLDLAGGATLRWDSYVNLRHVYRVDWSYLKVYYNPEAPQLQTYRFERESMIRLLAKSKVLTNYEAGPQHQRPTSVRVQTQHHVHREIREAQSPKSDTSSVTSEYSVLTPILQSDFGVSKDDGTRDIEPPPKAPPDKKEAGRRSVIRYILHCVLWVPLLVVKRVWYWLGWCRNPGRR